ncbi:MAG: NAD-dependent epimerase/dehydratase family protein [Chloroflexota bacterium]|jgi:dihydroflavonol-4-reductase
MKAVITGATGFVGGAIARRLAGEGIDVQVLIRPTTDLGRLSSYAVTRQAGDITDPATLTYAFDGADWVIHAAGMLGQAGVAEETYIQVNAEGTRNVLAAVAEARDAGRTPENLRVLHVGSAGVLGPLRRGDQETLFDETMPTAPSNAYERSKTLAENYAREFALSGLPVIIARPEFGYGPSDTHVLGLFQAIQRGVFFYIGGGQNTCHPTYVDDMVDGLELCLRQGRPGETYQITGPRPVTFRGLAETIARELGVRPPWLRIPRPLALAGVAGLEAAGNLMGRTMPLSRTAVAFFSESRRFSYVKAHRELDYTPQVDLEAGVARTVDWYRAEGML